MDLEAKGLGKMMEKNLHLAIWLYLNMVQKAAVKCLIPEIAADELVNSRR